MKVRNSPLPQPQTNRTFMALGTSRYLRLILQAWQTQELSFSQVAERHRRWVWCRESLDTWWSSSSLATARSMCLGVTRHFLLSRAALPASSRISAATHNRVRIIYFSVTIGTACETWQCATEAETSFLQRYFVEVQMQTKCHAPRNWDDVWPCHHKLVENNFSAENYLTGILSPRTGKRVQLLRF